MGPAPLCGAGSLPLPRTPYPVTGPLPMRPADPLLTDLQPDPDRHADRHLEQRQAQKLRQRQAFGRGIREGHPGRPEPRDLAPGQDHGRYSRQSLM